MADTAVSMVPCPEIITTGTCGSSPSSARRMPNPSMREPCSQMSRMTSEGRRARNAAMAAVESPACRVS